MRYYKITTESHSNEYLTASFYEVKDDTALFYIKKDDCSLPELVASFRNFNTIFSSEFQISGVDFHSNLKQL